MVAAKVSTEHITTETVETARGRINVYGAGSDDGIPVVLVHGNMSTGWFFAQLMAQMPSQYRVLAPDMRGFGRTEQRVIDATRGLRDWSDDLIALLEALAIDAPVHLAGWSTGGAAVANFAVDAPDRIASLTLIDPVSPYGFGSTFLDGRSPTPDFAGTGGGGANPEFVERLQNGDRSTDSPFSPLSVMRSSYWSPEAVIDPLFEARLVDEVLLSEIGESGYPGDARPSSHWPGFAPGDVGVLNALSPKHCRWGDLTQIAEPPPVLWVHGSNDLIVSNQSAWDIAAIGATGAIPGWPGAEEYPVQQMVDQIDTVLGHYQQVGGRVSKVMIEGAGHGPFLDHPEQFNAAFFEHLAKA